MLFGAHPATVADVREIDIHGTHMYDVAFRLEGENQPRSTRLGIEALYGVPAAGDRVVVHLLMNVATRIERQAT